ncbi:MAG: ferrochelatase, partial [Burkholderiales bacterium]
MREYLAEFLSDPRVVPLPGWLWRPLLERIVLPRRAPDSAEKYAQIWLSEGSPLAVYTARMARALAERVRLPVAYAMRYGRPKIETALAKVEDPVVMPLYPQYAESSTGSVLAALPPGTRTVREFHDHPAYIEALACVVRRHWSAHGRSPLLVMSFHGLPKRGGQDYERDCRASARLLARALELNDAAWRVT